MGYQIMTRSSIKFKDQLKSRLSKDVCIYTRYNEYDENYYVLVDDFIYDSANTIDQAEIVAQWLCDAIKQDSSFPCKGTLRQFKTWVMKNTKESPYTTKNHIEGGEIQDYFVGNGYQPCQLAKKQLNFLGRLR
jgi:hypothetical protein